MMLESGVEVDHTTLYRWVQKYAPEIQKRLRWYNKHSFGDSCRVDETYVKVKGKWKYLYRAIDTRGRTIEFYLSNTRNTGAAKLFLGKCLRQFKDYEHPRVINTDQNAAYNGAIKSLKKEKKLSKETLHRKVKYLNNIIEFDHGKLKRLIFSP